MTNNYDLRVLLVFAVVFSLTTLGGVTSSNFHLPSIPLASATVSPHCVITGSSCCPGPPGPCIDPYCQTTGSSGACAENWYPAGPSMTTFQGTIFTNEVTEYSTGLLASSPTIDFTDYPVPAGISTGAGSQLGGPGYLVTGQIPALGYYELQFNLAATILGCNMAHGNSACGVNIRQGIAHMIDKTIFASSDPGLPSGTGVALDNPVPTNAAGGLLSPDSCLYDNRNIVGWFNQTNASGSLCSVGAGNGSNVGGGSYHVAAATGADGFAWLQAPGSKDLNEAAAHFVMAGVATGCDGGTGASSCLTSTDSKLSGVVASTCSVPSCNFFIRNDSPPRLDFGNGIEASTCYILTGSFGTPGCSFFPFIDTGGAGFPGFVTCNPGLGTCTTGENTSWGIYTAAYNSVPFYDGSLYFTYNSRFVDGIGSNQISGGGPCSNAAVPTSSPSNYMYLCSASYDSLSAQMETSPCLTASGDPVAGATSNVPSPGTCVPSGLLSSHSAGILAEAAFGQGVYTIPIFQTTDQFGYLQCSTPSSSCASSSSDAWLRADNNAGVGLPNYFTWLNAWNANPKVSGTLRQGFRQTTLSVNPFIARAPSDTFITGGIFDSLYAQDPLNPVQFFNWMTENTQTLTSVSYTTGGVIGAPSGTAVTYRFTLRPDLTFQDGRPVTSYDAAFSYLSEVASGAVLGTSASAMTGITILSPTVFDIGVNSTGTFVLPNLTSIPIIPGRYWTNAGQSTWDSEVSACSAASCPDIQYTLTGTTVNCTASTASCANFPATTQTINTSDLAASFDPTATSILIGSGPWQCGNPAAGGTLGKTCFTGTHANGATSYTLTAYTNYFRSSQRLAIYLWSLESDTNAIGPATAVGSCFNLPVNLAGPCSHWQQGAGNPGSGTIVSVTTIGNVDIFFNLNWLSPFEWASTPPTGIAPLPPLLYGLVAIDGSTTYTPNPGGSSCAVPNTYYDC